MNRKIQEPALKVILVGAGWVTRNRHVPALLSDRRCRIVGVVDRSPEKAKDLGDLLGVRWSANELPSHSTFWSEADAVTCGTSPMTHFAVVKDSLLHGKHVLVEKPFAMSEVEGTEIVGLARDRNLVLGVVHNFQFAPSFQKVEKWIGDGRVGEIRAVHAFQFSNPKRRLPQWYEELPLGLFYDESPHLLYLVRRLADGEPRLSSVVVHPSVERFRKTPSILEAHFSTEKFPIAVQMNFDSAVSEWHIIVSGSNGSALCDIFRDVALFIPNDEDHSSLDVLRTSIYGISGHVAGVLRNGIPHLTHRLRYGNDEVFRRFVSTVLGSDSLRGMSADDALAVLALQHKIVEQADRWMKR